MPLIWIISWMLDSNDRTAPSGPIAWFYGKTTSPGMPILIEPSFFTATLMA